MKSDISTLKEFSSSFIGSPITKHSLKTLSSPPPTNGPPSCFLTQTFLPPPNSRSIFPFAGIKMKNIRLSKKGFFPVSLYRAIKSLGHGKGFFMSCPGLLKTTLLGNKKNQGKN